MAATNPIKPKSGRNHIQFDYISPITDNARQIGITKGTSGTEWYAFNNSATAGSRALEIDRINEFTAAAGITIDSVLVKDGGVRLASQQALQVRNFADSGTLDLVKLDATDQLILGSSTINTLLQGTASIIAQIGGTTKFTVQSSGIALSNHTTAGSAGASAGYVQINVNGSTFKVQLFSV